jgi:hypothetical protein
MELSFLAALCAGELVLVTTSLMGMLGLCSFRRAFKDGGGGGWVYLNKGFYLFFVDDTVAFL